MAALVLALTGAPATARPSADKNIVRTAQAAGTFKTLTKLLTKAGLAGTLSQPGPYTVFAPTDAAFEKVPKSTLKSLAKHKAKLRAVLLYHVVAGNVPTSKVVMLKSVKTLEREAVPIRVAGGTVFVEQSEGDKGRRQWRRTASSTSSTAS